MFLVVLQVFTALALKVMTVIMNSDFTTTFRLCSRQERFQQEQKHYFLL
jgi:hypothetical protein